VAESEKAGEGERRAEEDAELEATASARYAPRCQKRRRATLMSA